MKTNVLYYGDNLDVLRRHIPDASVDLIYLDPPFNSSRSYNVLFRESTGAASEAQLEAFEDTWQWAPKTAQIYEEIVTGPHQQVARMLKAMVEGLGHNDVTAYLTMMAVRLVELHRVLKDNGSIYLHCDPTAGPYLRVLMDSVFEPRNFVNEIVWKRSSAHSDVVQGAKHFGRIHDTILFYSKGDERTWKTIYTPYEPEYVDNIYRYVDAGGRRYQTQPLHAAKPGGDTLYEWKGKKPPAGRYWAFSKENMERLEREGRIVYSKTGVPRYKIYLDESSGASAQDLWFDLLPVHNRPKERLGYATQKPLALLERIIAASSNPSDVVLDPFCGCGTAVHAAHKLDRRWIGIDVTHLAIGLVRRRMQDAFPSIAIEVIGEPVDLAGAQELAKRDKYQFQWWALDRLGAQPVAGKKKGADKGIDGVIPFFAGSKEDYKRVIVSVKGGEKVNVGMVRDLVGVLDREKEPVGVLLTLEPPTQPMITEAAAAGIYHNDFWKKNYPRVQILTIEEILAGKRPQTPQAKSPGAQKSPFAKAPTEQEQAEQGELMS
ncbi:MAG: DNA methyltransferase [Dehalococcoidia bacterium]|nr:DNA methyltransferase [Dehalococcoidia bacterium]